MLYQFLVCLIEPVLGQDDESVVLFEFHLLRIPAHWELGGVCTRQVPDSDFESELNETSSKYGLDGLLENVDAWNKQPVNIAVINSFSTNIITVCFITN